MADEAAPEPERPAHRPPRLPKAEERLGVSGESKPTRTGTKKTGEKKVDTVSKREARKGDTVIIRNRRNFPITIRVAREVVNLGPYEQREVARDLAEHPDFTRHVPRRVSVKEKN